MHKNTVIAITNGNMCVGRHASEIIETKKMHIEREQQQNNESWCLQILQYVWEMGFGFIR